MRCAHRCSTALIFSISASFFCDGNAARSSSPTRACSAAVSACAASRCPSLPQRLLQLPHPLPQLHQLALLLLLLLLLLQCRALRVHRLHSLLGTALHQIEHALLA